ncbi:MAG: SpoIIE family protein phosphatase [Firmicutes bacterium]|nr:SpoIIE family protein phosphatase [Bacillota bacterium]
MRKFWKLVIGGIESKIFNLVLVTVILILIAGIVVLEYQSRNLTDLVDETNTKQTEAIRKTSTETIHGIIYEGLAKENYMASSMADSLFQEHYQAISMLGDYAQKLYDDPDQYPRIMPPQPKADEDGTVTAQLILREGVDPSDPALADELGLLGNLDDMLVSMYQSFPNMGSCFIGTKSGILLMADDMPSTKVLSDGSIIHMDPTSRVWFTEAGTDGKIFFTSIDKDSFTDRIGTVCARPIYQNGEIIAVVGSDLFLNDMETQINTQEETGQYVFIINENGQVIFSPKTRGILQAKPSKDAVDLRQAPDTELAEFVAKAMQGQTEVTLVHMESEAFYMAGCPIPTTGWALISVIPENTADLSTQQMLKNYRLIQTEATETFRTDIKLSKSTILVLLTAILLITLAGSVSLGRKIAEPLRKMTKKILSLGKDGGDAQFYMEDAYRTGDEVQLLAESFADISERTVAYVEEVKRVTAEKERIGAELSMATDIQESQLPHIFPAFPDRKEFDLYASMDPAKEVGGDFYDFFLVDQDHLGLVMADVSGKGIPAALFMMIAKILIKNRVLNGDSPAKALETVNQQLLDGNEAGMFVTVWLAVIEISTGKGIVSNAGHEHPAIRRKDGSFELIKYRHSPAVAAFDDLTFEEHEFRLYPGDQLFIYTDGVTEAMNKDRVLFGTDRMIEALNEAKDEDSAGILAKVSEKIKEFVADADQFDDITMLCLKYNGPEGGK